MRVVIVDTDVASFLFKGDTRGDLYTPHLEGDTLPVRYEVVSRLRVFLANSNCQKS